MSEIYDSDTHREIVNQAGSEAFFEALSGEHHDGTCTTGYDNDGSTGFEIFENGFELAKKAAGRDVWRVEHPDNYVAWFFIGTEDEVSERLRKIAAEAKAEELVEG